MRRHITILRILLTATTAFLLSATAANADPDELVTAPNAILCMNADDLDTATAPSVARSQIVLQAMGCMRSEGGIRIRVVRNVPDGSWQVRFYPAGISGGVTLWGRPSSFVAPNGSPAGRAKQI